MKLGCCGGPALPSVTRVTMDIGLPSERTWEHPGTLAWHESWCPTQLPTELELLGGAR